MENQNNYDETRPIAGISGLKFRAVGKINLTQGDTESLVIHADPEVRSRIRTEILDGILVISYDSDWKDWTGINFLDKGITSFNLTMKEINSLTISGVGNLDAPSITTGSLSLSLSGPATITIGTLQVNSLSVEMSGVGSIDVAGKCADQSIALSGAGSYKSPRLETERTSVKLSGVGNATIWAKESLDADISGAGAVEYYGAAKITQKISGIGVLKYLGNR
jgi:hypothetical protein